MIGAAGTRAKSSAVTWTAYVTTAGRDSDHHIADAFEMRRLQCRWLS
jgi:hypothetical protein